MKPESVKHDRQQKTEIPDLAGKPSRKYLIGLLALAVAAVLLPLIGVSGGLAYAQDIASKVRGIGWWTLPIYCLIAGTAVGFALVPSHLTSLVSGWLYGLAGGGLAALVVIAAGAAISYWGSRALAQDTVRALIDRYRWSRLLAKELIDTSTGKATLAMTLTRLPPQVPFALGNILAASCRVPWRVFLPGTLLGMTPRVLLVVWVGATMASLEPGAPIPGALWWALGTAIAGFGGLIIWSGLLLRRYGNDRTAAAPSS